MATISISLSDEMKAHIEAQVAGGNYNNASEYVRDLIRKHRRDLELERIDRLLIEGLESGNERELTDRDWDEWHSMIRNHKPSDRVAEE